MTPPELQRALDLLDLMIDGNATPEQREAAKADLQSIRGLLRDVRSGPDDVRIGRQASLIKPSVTLMKLQIEAPPGALDGMLRWVENQRGSRGRRAQDFTLVTEDGAWTKVLEPQPARVYKRA